MNMMADLVLKEVNQDNNSSHLPNPSLSNSQEFKKVGEELLIDKIKSILDEVAREKHDYEESYESNTFFRGRKQQKDLMNTSV